MNLNLQGLIRWATSFEGLVTLAGGYLGYRYYGSKLGSKWVAGGAGMAAGMGAASMISRLSGGLSAQSQAALQPQQALPQASEYVDLDGGGPTLLPSPQTSEAAAHAAAVTDMGSLGNGDGLGGFGAPEGFDADALDYDTTGYLDN